MLFVCRQYNAANSPPSFEWIYAIERKTAWRKQQDANRTDSQTYASVVPVYTLYIMKSNCLCN